MKKLIFSIIVISLIISVPAYAVEWPQYAENPKRIQLHESQFGMSGRGGIIVADLNNDGLLDYIVSTKEKDTGDDERAALAAYDHSGDLLWVQDGVDIVLTTTAEKNGLPGWHGPGIAASDVDEDGMVEVIHLSTRNEVVIRDGMTGDVKEMLYVPLPTLLDRAWYAYEMIAKNPLTKKNVKYAVKQFLEKPKRWSYFHIVNLVGEHDTEIILQADPWPFRWLKAIRLPAGTVLWQVQDYHGCRHNGFRAADVDNDGFDEVLGSMLIEEDGTMGQTWDYRTIRGHLDSLFIRDIRPHVEGLEWIVLEESHRGDDRTALLGKERIFFYHSFKGREPQNAAVGDFDPTRPGLEIWCRSRFKKDQQPWLIDAYGKTITNYRINDAKPAWWSDQGIETMTAIDWTGKHANLIAAKERHTNGSICIINPLTGAFLHTFNEHAARLYVVDVSGDAREEMVVINTHENEIHIYWNAEENPQPTKTRLWRHNYYRRQKMYYNYYST